ncbi:stage II sporulation protein D [Aeribacillus composti]|uniref:stage II sporulation protein D n=1 Tax=Aeribacillus composti TaxID=1868734 RepID=UPI002E1EA39D|nr:stage II sporulation protein D [Aeribacillus composti]MED0746028.1 stage II sporulation protein D [Aeribacillus composti]
MKRVKPFFLFFAAIFFIILMVPSLLVAPFAEKTKATLGEELAEKETTDVLQKESKVSVPIYRSQEKKIDEVPLEEYVVGVVAAEMPAEFEKEALKAQALAARTYIVKELFTGQNVGSPEGAVVTDTELHQVYKNEEELRRIWKKDFDWKIKKIKEAVAETRGQILTYDDKPIDASFFSTSNGYTENSEAIWPNALPYLKSVESPWDEKSEKFLAREVFTVQEFEQKLGIKIGKGNSIGKIIERTPGHRVALVEINGKKFTGREIREKLGLRSTDFSWTLKGDQIIVTTKGYGHGVGMSQYGANFMAQEGKNYKEIVSHYYQGIEISQASPFLSKYMAKK